MVLVILLVTLFLHVDSASSCQEGTSRECANSTRPSARKITGYAIRLVNGSSSLEGRVEIFFNGTWGTVCDDSWSHLNAVVVCRQLGHRILAVRAYSNALFGPGTGQIWLDTVNCIGNETHLENCPSSPLGQHDCSHSEDAGVTCDANSRDASGRALRLVNGAIPQEGRVEIFHNGTWGTVCDDGWSLEDATVVCHELGYNTSAVRAYSGGFFGKGTGTIWLDDVRCTGSERRLLNCPSRSPGQHNCGHSQDAGVSCDTTRGIASGIELRLVNGPIQQEGRVELFLNGSWGTVCDDDWSLEDATVVCRQLGYNTSVVKAYSGAFFGQGSGIIWVDDVKCTGNETRLLDCPSSPPGQHNCRHNEDAGVFCDASSLSHRERLRLVNGDHVLEGRVEIFINGSWGTVCNNTWTVANAQVVCRHLGLEILAVTYYSSSRFGSGTGRIWMTKVKCQGSETSLLDCPSRPFGYSDCDHNQDVGVSCDTTRGVSRLQGAIRLVNGSHSGEGRVEILLNVTWGTVCDDDWTIYNTQVICRQLGFNTLAVGYYPGAYYGQGTGTIWLDDVRCHGNESRLVDCWSQPFGYSDCRHGKDVGVSCDTTQDTDDCKMVRCQQGASCLDLNKGYTCVCPTGFSGRLCEIRLISTEKNEAIKWALIGVSSCLGILLVAIVAIILVICYKRMSSKIIEKKQDRQDQHVGCQDGGTHCQQQFDSAVENPERNQYDALGQRAEDQPNNYENIKLSEQRQKSNMRIGGGRRAGTVDHVYENVEDVNYDK